MKDSSSLIKKAISKKTQEKKLDSNGENN